MSNEPKLYDVLAVNIRTSRVRLLEQGKTLERAEYVVETTTGRRVMDAEFCTRVPSGQYKDGDKFGEPEKQKAGD